MRDIGREVRWLVRLYPKSYRDEYGDEIEQAAQDMIAGAPNALARWAVYVRLLTDLPRSAAVAQLQVAGETVGTSPRYIKRSSLIALALVAPFFAAIAAQALDHAATGRDLSNSWLWSTPILTTWVLVLPAVAFLVSLVSYLIYAVTPAVDTTRIRRATDVRRTCPTLVPLVIAAGVIFFLLFHDSAHCVAQSPIETVTHLHQTWRCTSSGFLGGR